MKIRLIRRVFTLGICALAATAVNAAQQSIGEIEASVERFLQGQLSSTGTVEIKPLDSRLRLPACKNPLHHDWASGSSTIGRVTVLTSCDSAQPWRVHVQARLTQVQSVWVAKRPLRRGDILTKDMVERSTVELGTQKNRVVKNDYPIEDLDSVVGYEFVQNTNSGRVLTQEMLKPNALIAKGERVILRYSSSALQLQTHVVAVTGGALGDRIQVKNPSSGSIIDARVTSQGVAETVY